MEKNPKAKYKSYKGDMNGTTKNLLIEKIVDKKKLYDHLWIKI